MFLSFITWRLGSNTSLVVPPPPLPIQCGKHVNVCKPPNLEHLLTHLPSWVMDITNFQHLAIYTNIDWRLLYTVAWEISNSTMISTAHHLVDRNNHLLPHLSLCREQILHQDTLAPEADNNILIKDAAAALCWQSIVVHLTVVPTIARGNPKDIWNNATQMLQLENGCRLCCRRRCHCHRQIQSGGDCLDRRVKGG